MVRVEVVLDRGTLFERGILDKDISWGAKSLRFIPFSEWKSNLGLPGPVRTPSRQVELSVSERYLCQKLGLRNLGWDGSRARTNGAVRSLLVARKTHPNYVVIRDKVLHMPDTPKAVLSWAWEMRDLIKHNNVLEFIEAEMLIEGKSDEEIERLLLLEAV